MKFRRFEGGVVGEIFRAHFEGGVVIDEVPSIRRGGSW